MKKYLPIKLKQESRENRNADVYGAEKLGPELCENIIGALCDDFGCQMRWTVGGSEVHRRAMIEAINFLVLINIRSGLNIVTAVKRFCVRRTSSQPRKYVSHSRAEATRLELSRTLMVSFQRCWTMSVSFFGIWIWPLDERWRCSRRLRSVVTFLAVTWRLIFMWTFIKATTHTRVCQLELNLLCTVMLSVAHITVCCWQSAYDEEQENIWGCVKQITTKENILRLGEFLDLFSM